MFATAVSVNIWEVGKNKLADHMLSLLCCEREYALPSNAAFFLGRLISTQSRAVRAPRCTQKKTDVLKGPAPSRHYAAESDGDANPSGLDSSRWRLVTHSYPGSWFVKKMWISCFFTCFSPPHGFPIRYHTRLARPGWGRVLARLGASSCCQSRAMRGGGWGR